MIDIKANQISECDDFSAAYFRRTMIQGLDVHVLNNLLCSAVSATGTQLTSKDSHHLHV